MKSFPTMEICRVQRQWPPISLRFNQKSPLRPETGRFHLSPNSRKSPLELSIGNQMFILGMGFVGQFFAADLKSKGWAVSGSCTSVEKKKRLEELGYQAYTFDANDPQLEMLEIVKNHTHLVVSIPTLKGLGDPMLRHKGLVESVLKDGKLSYPVKPSSAVAKSRLAAEEGWLRLGHDLGISAQVFRLGGIYGPGRSAVDTILKQEPLSKGQKMRLSKSYTSRVHVADICQALHASISKPSDGRIYNIVDDDPAPREEVFELAQKLAEAKFPGHVKQYISLERAESLAVENPPRGEKRVSNARMKSELGVNLLHPTYRSGLQNIVDHIHYSPGL